MPPKPKPKPKRTPRAPLTPAELTKLAEVFAQTGSYSEAGRAIGVRHSTAREALLRDAPDVTRRQLYARALDAGLAEVVDSQRLAAKLLRGDLRGGAKQRAQATGALNDTARAMAQSRTALAKLTGEHAAEKHEHKIETLTDDELDRRIAELERAAAVEGREAPPPGGEEG